MAPIPDDGQGASVAAAAADLARQDTPLPALRPVTLRDPLRWLAAGWHDFSHPPGIGLFYGACFVGMGWAMAWMFARPPAYILALAGGFILLGPFLCLGMYDVSRKREPSAASASGARRRRWAYRSRHGGAT